MSRHVTKSGMAAVSESAREVADDLGSTIQEGVEHGQKHAGRLFRRASHVAEDAKNMGLHQYHLVRRQVRRNAMASTLIAFATGFVISRFLFRR